MRIQLAMADFLVKAFAVFLAALALGCGAVPILSGIKTATERKISPQEAAFAREIRTRDLLLFGQRRLDDGQPEIALDLFNQAASLAPNDARAHYARGLALKALEQTDSARQAFEASVELAPRLWWAHWELAQGAIAEGDTERAEASLAVLDELGVDDPRVDALRAELAASPVEAHDAED